ncbi:MAG: tRNA 2-thiouridine(34) synthase MnmA [bacterium]
MSALSAHHTVALALSGGIDSAYAGWLLKQEGFEVIGVHLRLIEENTMSYAREAADVLDIPLHILDLRREFHTRIIEPFVNEYLSGRTPNPCVNCNAIIKCGILLDWARDRHIDRVVTGHYARICKDPGTGRALLQRGSDRRKDQSYFLYRLSQGQLEGMLFPLGTRKKRDVEREAEQLGIWRHTREESQEICFLSSRDYRCFLEKIAPHALGSGPVCDPLGKVMGSHSGIFRYTIGQRKGLQLSEQGPHYVLSLDPKRNLIVVGAEEDLWQAEMVVEGIHRIAGPWPQRVLVQIRSTQPPQEATLKDIGEGRVRVLFERPVRAITPGQSAVFYHEEVCLGGGIITAGSQYPGREAGY